MLDLMSLLFIKIHDIFPYKMKEIHLIENIIIFRLFFDLVIFMMMVAMMMMVLVGAPCHIPAGVLAASGNFYIKVINISLISFIWTLFIFKLGPHPIASSKLSRILKLFFITVISFLNTY